RPAAWTAESGETYKNLMYNGIVIHCLRLILDYPSVLCWMWRCPVQIRSSYRVISAIAIEIRPIATEADRIWLEEAADVGGVKAVAQIIQAKLLIPLLAGEEMPHAVARRMIRRVPVHD